MNSAFIVAGAELNQDTAQVCLPEHDQVVDALHLAGKSPHRGACRCLAPGPASLPTRMGPIASSRGNRFALLRSRTKPTGLTVRRRFHHLRYSGCTWLTIIRAAIEATMISRVVSTDALSLSRGEQSSTTRGRGVRSRSEFGPIELFNHQHTTARHADAAVASRFAFLIVRPQPR
jgi:hypothetical protein